MKSELQIEAERRLEPRYSRTYKIVFGVVIVVGYGFGYFEAWSSFGGLS